MKKVFLAIAALAVMTACNNDEVMNFNREEITVGNVFVDNATRAVNNDYSGTKALTTMNVYGTVTGKSTTGANSTVLIFNGAEFTGAVGNAAWSITDATKKQYWMPNCAYDFAAVVDGNVKATDGNGMPTMLGYTLTEDGDLLYATASATTGSDAVPTGTNVSTSLVNFTFNHLLAKVQFEVVMPTLAAGYSYKVGNITMTNVPAAGICDLTKTVDAVGRWAQEGDSTTTLNFRTVDGDTVTLDDHLIIPMKQTVTINLSYEVLFNGDSISVVNVSKPLEYTFAEKTVYNIKAALPAQGKEIQFSVTAKPGAFANGGDVTVQ